MHETERTADILLVEDNPADIDLTEESLKEARIKAELHAVKDGVEAMQFLRREEPHVDAPTPDLILLDLNLPRMDGRKVLEKCKNDDELKMIPIVVLTSSEAERDIIKAYDLHANSYIVKPVNLDRFVEIMKQVGGFWLRVVKLPDR